MLQRVRRAAYNPWFGEKQMNVFNNSQSILDHLGVSEFRYAEFLLQ